MALGPAEIHVWAVRLDVAASGIASAEEQARAARFVRARDGAAYLAARGALRALLGRYCGVDPAAIAFAAGPWGKPALAGALAATGLAFNLAHSGAHALIAFARGRSVGVDIETPRALPEALAIARRICGAAAADALARLDPAERTPAFFRLWTAHEACIKAVGSALAAAAQSVRMGFDERGPYCAWAAPALAPHGLALAPLAVEGEQVAAVAWTRTAPPDAAPQIARFDFAG